MYSDNRLGFWKLCEAKIFLCHLGYEMRDEKAFDLKKEGKKNEGCWSTWKRTKQVPY